MTQITKPGFHLDVPDKTYHLDCCPQPSLSASIAKVIFQQSAGHAWWAHPRLNPSKALEVEAEEGTKSQQTGAVLHRLILGKGREIKVLNFPDFRTAAARAAKEKAAAEGMTPILEKDMQAAEAVAESVRRQLGRSEIAELFGADAGDAEVTMTWQDNGIWCRSRIDWMPRNVLAGGHVIVPDIKTTSKSAHPEKWSKDMFEIGGDIQAAFYERGLRKLVPTIRTVDFRFVVIEQEPPYAISMCRCSGEALQHARETVDLAIRTFAACLARGRELEHWPFYDAAVNDIDPPAWRAAGSELLRMRMKDRISRWQRPLSKDADQAA